MKKFQKNLKNTKPKKIPKRKKTKIKVRIDKRMIRNRKLPRIRKNRGRKLMYTLMLLLLWNNTTRDTRNTIDKIEQETQDHLLDNTQITRQYNLNSNWSVSKGTSHDTGTNFCLVTGNWNNCVTNRRLPSNKIRNRNVRAYNGNRVIRNVIKLAHWNVGNSRWEKKRLEVEALTIEKTPDILYISEANLWGSVPDFEREINGYDMYIPKKMMNRHQYARIILLVRQGIDSFDLRPGLQT